MPLSLFFRTVGAWGAGLGRRLTNVEADTNTYTLKTAIEALQSSPPTAISIASISVDQLKLKVTLTNGTVLGPFPLPILEWRFRYSWTPFTAYAALDAFVVDGMGLYVVLADHTSGATFDPNLLVSGDPALKLMMGMDSGTFANIYDIDAFYPGRPSDSTNALLMDFPVLRNVTLPIASGNHYAYLTTAPSTTQQVYPISHDGTHVGDITFAISSDTGVFSWLGTTDIEILKGERVQIGKSTTSADPVACGLSVGLACQRVTSP